MCRQYSCNQEPAGHLKVSYSNEYNIVLNLKWLYSLVLSGITDILLLITHSRLSITQASSSIKCLDMCAFTHAIPTFITEAFRLVTQVQLLLLMTVALNKCLIQ